MSYILEVCVDSVESAIAAINGGADRLELCSNLIIGGTTPSISIYKEIRKISSIPIHVLIRPRFGDFCYSNYEFSVMRDEIKCYEELGANGIVIGVLSEDGTIDYKRMETLVNDAKKMSITLHRAFDVCENPFRAMDAAIELGIHTILTSGQKNICMEGKKLLNELCIYGANKIDIMAGSGIDANAIEQLLEETTIKSFHMSGKKVEDSKMIYRKNDICMGLPVASEYDIWRTDLQSVMNAKKVLVRNENKLSEKSIKNMQ